MLLSEPGASNIQSTSNIGVKKLITVCIRSPDKDTSNIICYYCIIIYRVRTYTLETTNYCRPVSRRAIAAKTVIIITYYGNAAKKTRRQTISCYCTGTMSERKTKWHSSVVQETVEIAPTVSRGAVWQRFPPRGIGRKNRRTLQCETRPGDIILLFITIQWPNLT